MMPEQANESAGWKKKNKTTTGGVDASHWIDLSVSENNQPIRREDLQFSSWLADDDVFLSASSVWFVWSFFMEANKEVKVKSCRVYSTEIFDSDWKLNELVSSDWQLSIKQNVF